MLRGRDPSDNTKYSRRDQQQQDFSWFKSNFLQTFRLIPISIKSACIFLMFPTNDAIKFTLGYLNETKHISFVTVTEMRVKYFGFAQHTNKERKGTGVCLGVYKHSSLTGKTTKKKIMQRKPLSA